MLYDVSAFLARVPPKKTMEKLLTFRYMMSPACAPFRRKGHGLPKAPTNHSWPNRTWGACSRGHCFFGFIKNMTNKRTGGVQVINEKLNGTLVTDP